MTVYKSLTLDVSLLAMTASMASADAMTDLATAAGKVANLTMIALPHDRCAYGAVTDAFKKNTPRLPSTR